VTEEGTPVTALLRAWRSGDAGAFDLLLPAVYRQLHSLAAAHLRSERQEHTLSATALVHEAYLRLIDSSVDWNDRVHFYAIAAGTIRRILIDHARSHKRQKRGAGVVKISLEVAAEFSREPQADLLDLDQALTDLAQFDERKAKLVELIYFGGMEVGEAASVTGISVATAHRDLKLAKAWLYTRLEPEDV
jgi:RNA polymerase sigma-70 factor (ECF subfamily)